MFLHPPEELVGPTWSANLIPSFSDAQHLAANGQSDAPRVPGFLTQARVAVELRPDNPLALARLAQAAQAAGYTTDAVEYARKAMDAGLDASQPGAVHAAMTILAACGQARDAAMLIDDPRASRVPVAVRVRAAAAAGEFDAAQRLPGIEGSPDALQVITWIRTEQGDFRGAIAAGREAERGGAGGVTLYVNLAFAHAALGNHRKAVRLARQARGLSPTDRRVAFRLVHYLKLAGKHDEAFVVLESLGDPEHPDIELALGLARALSDDGSVSAAHSVLQRARASREWAFADDVQRAELTANLALLRWMTRRERADSSRREIIRALEASDYESLGIAYLLMNVMRMPEHADELARVIGRLESRHDEKDLLGLRTLLAILVRDAGAAVAYSRAWAQHDLFNPHAAAAATLLIGEVGGDFHEAGELGLATCRRVPHDVMLLNNTALVLAMDGRLELAESLLARGRRQAGDTVYLSATQGLVDLLAGRTERGREGYGRALEMAEDADDEALCARVTLYAAFAEQAAGAESTVGDPASLMESEAMKKWRDLPLFWIAWERLKREAAA